MAKFNNDSKFDIDLEYGQEREKTIAKIIERGNLEVNLKEIGGTLQGILRLSLKAGVNQVGLKLLKQNIGYIIYVKVNYIMQE